MMETGFQCTGKLEACAAPAGLPGGIQRKQAGGPGLSRMAVAMVQTVHCAQIQAQAPGLIQTAQEQGRKGYSRSCFLPRAGAQGGVQNSRPVSGIKLRQRVQLGYTAVQGGIFRAQEGEDAVSKAVTPEAGIGIGAIFQPGNLTGVQQSTQFLRRTAQKRSQQVTLRIQCPHSAKSGPAGASNKAQQHILFQIFLLMSCQDPGRRQALPFCFQHSIAQLAPGFFQSQTVASSMLCHRSLPQGTGNPPAGAVAGNDKSFVWAFRTQPMIHMQHMQGTAKPGAEQIQTADQR